MRTIKRNGAVCLKRLGVTYFVLVHGRNVFECDYNYDAAVVIFNQKVTAQSK